MLEEFSFRSVFYTRHPAAFTLSFLLSRFFCYEATISLSFRRNWYYHADHGLSPAWLFFSKFHYEFNQLNALQYHKRRVPQANVGLHQQQASEQPGSASDRCCSASVLGTSLVSLLLDDDDQKKLIIIMSYAQVPCWLIPLYKLIHIKQISTRR